MNTNALAIIQRKGPTQKAREIVSAKPVLGKPLGNFKLKLKYLDGRALELGGFVSDVTGLCVGKKAQKDFKRVIFEQAESMGYTIPEENIGLPVKVPDAEKPLDPEEEDMPEDRETDVDVAAIQAAINDLNSFDFLKCCRVVLLEESGQKHLIIQIRRLKLLTEYAYNIDSAQWSYFKGLKYDYLLDGRASSLPYPKTLWGLGKIYIHIFIPDDDHKAAKEDSEYLDKAKNLTPIVPMIREIGDVYQILKAKDSEIDAANYGLGQIQSEFSEKTTKTMNATIAIVGLEDNGATIPEPKNNRLGIFQYLSVIGLGLLIGCGASTFGILGWPVGFMAGNMAGFALIQWRH